MKYMGSKRSMLLNGLGTLLDKEILSAKRFVDLFTGSGAVAVHVAQRADVPVVAYDLQSYSAVLAMAVIGRNRKLDAAPIWREWNLRAAAIARRHHPVSVEKLTRKKVAEARAWSAEKKELAITSVYGGHYFSPQQAVWIDALNETLPESEPERTVARAALIQAASKCAASPGHTAQPFQPTRTAKKFLSDAWNRDVTQMAESAFYSLASICAKQIGTTQIADANEAAKTLKKGDLVFLDPPYSGVHYSRFYHVLETIARGGCGKVTGVGRYPSEQERPRSRYSVTSEASAALDDLLKTISSRGAKAILTFPDHNCSNGLSGNFVRKIARKHFQITTERVKSLFSTMGGTGNTSHAKPQAKRKARRIAKELMLVLEPKGDPDGVRPFHVTRELVNRPSRVKRQASP